MDQDNTLEATSLLEQQDFTVKDTELSYRVLNHWSEVGLIQDRREEASAWRKLTIKDLLWIKILTKLREYGLSIEKLLKVRAAIFTHNDPEQTLEFAISGCVAYVPMFLIVWPDGDAEIESAFWLKGMETTLNYPDYLRINLNMLWYELTGDEAEPYFDRIKSEWHEWKNPTQRNKAEAHVLELMRDTQYHKIQVTRNAERDGYQIDASRVVEGAVSISKALHDLQFGEMFIKVANGRPYLTTLTKKRKLKK